MLGVLVNTREAISDLYFEPLHVSMAIRKTKPELAFYNSFLSNADLPAFCYVEALKSR